MTLAQYKASLLSMPSTQATVAAGPAHALEADLALGEPFIPSRDRVCAQAWHRASLDRSEQLANFSTLSGP